ncbi:unnamed protein product [Withania somnifera]
MGTTPLAARVSDPKGMENERRICVHYLWSGVTILNLLFPISPFGYYRQARLGPILDLFENYQGRSLSLPLVLESYQSPLLPLTSVLHRIMSPCENFLFYWHPIGRLLD